MISNFNNTHQQAMQGNQMLASSSGGLFSQPVGAIYCNASQFIPAMGSPGLRQEQALKTINLGTGVPGRVTI